MHYDTLTKEEEYEELVKETNRKSIYQKLPPVERKYMSVPEMGKLLGLKKTARYWLVKKGYFKVETIIDTLYVDLASFEEWYANQSWYKKVTGEEPGVALKEESYSVEDIHKMLGLNRSHIRCLMKDAGIEYITVSHRRRYLKSQFDQWMQDHVRYQEAAERVREQEREKKETEENSVAIGLGLTTRNRKHKESGNVSGKGTKTFSKNEKVSLFHKDYLTIQEAAACSGTHPSAISKWMKRKKFPYIRMGNVIRIPRESFENYINQHMKISKDARKD